MYKLDEHIEYDVNTKPRAREIAKDLLAVIDSPNHKDREYVLRQVINKILYGVRGELYLRDKDITVGDFLLHYTDVGQVCHILDGGYNCCMVEVDDEDLFMLPKDIGKRVIKELKYDYDKRINDLPLITINI